MKKKKKKQKQKNNKKKKKTRAHFSIIYFYLHSCIVLSPDWSIDFIHVSMKLSSGTTFGKWLVSRALQTHWLTKN